MRAAAILCCCAAVWAQNAALAQTALRCGPFAAEAPAPVARGAASAGQRFAAIKRAVKSQPHRILFLGDSLTERFPHDAPEVWRDHMAPRGVLNAGVSGDRTDNLLWRLRHGNLAGQKPAGIVVLIGTNDLTYEHGSRPVEVAAEGVRANLLYLLQRLPSARILLLGLLPRGAAPEGGLRRKTVAVNRLIQACGDERAIVYADIGGVLLDPQGHLTAAIAPDLLHFSPLGYARLAAQLDPLIDQLVGSR
jgi:beta-glucosidase